ncbi:MAG: hypothetical protein SOI13_04400 [Bifidobacterium mongoliense]
MKTLHARLHAYKPFGSSLGLLSQPTSFDASCVHDDDGSITITYSRRALNGDILQRALESGLEIAVEVSDGTGYVEPANMRYLVTGRSGDSTDESDTIRLTGPSISWLLSKILNNDTRHLITDGDNKGKRAFLSSNPGTITCTLLDENKTRGGAATGLSWDFDTAKDSGGDRWARVYTLYYSLGTSLQAALSSMVGGAAVDWRTNSRRLSVWNADSSRLSRDLSGSVRLDLTRDLGDAPNEESISDLASDILVEGDNGLIFRQSNPAAPTPWGKWESYVSQGGVSDEATAKSFMQATLASSARVRGQYTRTIITTGVDDLPLIDYRPGDWITAPTVNHGEKTRVQQVTVSLDSEGKLSASIILNDIRYDASVRQAKKMAGITGGAALAGSEGGRPAPENDHRTPNAPQGLVVDTSAYMDSTGYARGLASLEWAQVTAATDGTGIDIASYRVDYRKSVAGAPWMAGGSTEASKTSLGIGNLECGVTYEFRVRAIPTYSDSPGLWSTVVVALVASDVTPPSVPSAPIASSDLAVVKLHWNGLTASGAHMERDFDHLDVAQGTGVNDLKVIAANATGTGDYLVTGLTVGSKPLFAFRAVDHSGNASAWSAVAQVTVDSAVRPADIKALDDDIASNKTAIGDANKAIAKNTTDITTANGRLSTAQSDIAKAKSDITRAQGDISANAAAITTANGKLATAQSDIRDTRTDLATANGKLSTAQSDITTAKSDIAANAASITDANKAIAKNTTDITTANGRLSTAQSDIAKAKSDITSNSSSIEQSRIDIANAAGTAKTALDKANSVSTSVDGLHNVYQGPDDPTGLANTTVRIGDTWRRTQRYWTRWQGDADNSPSLLADFYTYWQGEPDNSPSVLVTLDSRIVDISVWDGLRWNAIDLIARNVLALGSITGELIAANTIRGNSIIAGSISTDRLAALSITTPLLAALAVTVDKLAANSVSTDKLTANSVTGAKIAALSIDASKIVAGSVTGDRLAANTITAREIKAGAVTADQLAANSVTSAAIKALSITADDLAANSVTVDKLDANSVNASKIVAGSVTADRLAANSVTSAKIAAGAVTADDLAANSVVAGKIAANAVSAAAIVANSVTVDKLAANSVNASKIVAASITGDRLAANTITAREIKSQSITSDNIMAGQFKGYVFTGAVFQSSTAANTGIKISSTALQMWDSSHNQTVYLDGEGKNNVLTGSFQTATTGDRIMISAQATATIIGSSTSLSGQSIVFKNNDFATSPSISGYFTNSDVGYAPEITLYSGYKAAHDPAAVFYLQSLPLSQGATGSGITSRALISANTDYSEPDSTKKSFATLDLKGIGRSGAYASLEAHAYSGNKSEVWVTASRNDGVSSVGICADAFTQRIYIGGKLGGLTNQQTFQADNWKIISGHMGAGSTFGPTTVALSPAKYGVYHAVANADVGWGSIFIHVLNTGSASQYKVIGYNAGGAFDGDIWVDAIAWLT